MSTFKDYLNEKNISPAEVEAYFDELILTRVQASSKDTSLFKDSKEFKEAKKKFEIGFKKLMNSL